jgi:hypothetical protein
MNMAVNKLMQDLHKAQGQPYSARLGDTPEWYREQVLSICTELIEVGWTKTIIDFSKG